MLSYPLPSYVCLVHLLRLCPPFFLFLLRLFNRLRYSSRVGKNICCLTLSLCCKDKQQWIVWVCCVSQPGADKTAISGKRASIPLPVLSAPLLAARCANQKAGWEGKAGRHERWCHSHMDSGVVMLGGWETELCLLAGCCWDSSGGLCAADSFFSYGLEA